MRRHTLWGALLFGCGLLIAGCADWTAGTAGPANPVPPPAKKFVYVIVGRGQTLDHLAQTYHADKSDIIAANDLKPPYALKPNMLLRVPAAASEPVSVAAEPAPANKDHLKSAAPPRIKAKRSEPEVIPLD